MNSRSLDSTASRRTRLISVCCSVSTATRARSSGAMALSRMAARTVSVARDAGISSGGGGRRLIICRADSRRDCRPRTRDRSAVRAASRLPSSRSRARWAVI